MSRGSALTAALTVPTRDMKALGEALRVSESALTNHPEYSPLARHISALIRQVDEHRPLAPNGKHGSLHTATCGCEED